jgi:hypothetical protein
MSNFDRGQITCSTPPPKPPSPPQPLAGNTNGTGMQLAESAISSSGSSAFVNSFVDKFVARWQLSILEIAMEYSTTLPPSTQLMVPLSSGGVFSMVVKRR